MKNNSIKNEELEKLGKELNEKVNLFSQRLAQRFNQFFLNKRKLMLVLLIVFFIILLIINLLSYNYW